MQARGATLAPGILFDSDMGRNIDAALALAMLHGLGRGRVIAVGVSNSSLDAAAFCDAVARFYAGDAGLPVGLAEDGPKLDDAPMLSGLLGMRGTDGQPAFRHGVRSINDTADPAVVFRNALLTQQEQQGVVVLAGPATNLVGLLRLSGSRDIVASKVRLLVVAAGAFGGSVVDPRIRADISAARKVLADWPSPVVAVGMEAGNAAPYPDQSIEADFSWSPNHPIVAAYRAYREKQQRGSGASGVSSQAVLAALYVANPSADFLKLSAPGRIEAGDDGITRFRESAGGKHRYLIIDPMQKESVTQAFLALAAARPAAGRGTPPRNQ
jgi:inosine-uridine nucleoside N-ribohydrolase